jgi:hypothetical protein
VRKELEKLGRNPPEPEVPRVAYAVDFGTEFPLSKRFGGKQSSRNILILIGSGKHDPNEKKGDYIKVALKARRLGVTVIYMEIGMGEKVSFNVSGIPRDVLERLGLNVIKVSPNDLTDKRKVWGKMSNLIFRSKQ